MATALSCLALLGAANAAAASAPLLTNANIAQISNHWGQISPYVDNLENYFGVNNVGLPNGCQVEQAHTLQRHAQRFPTGGPDDGGNDVRFATKLSEFKGNHTAAAFTGPLTFLNTYKYLLGSSYLTNVGAKTEFSSGVSFWNRYGRTLYNATAGQVTYNATFQNATARPKPVIRTTGQSRIENSQINWGLGFFGPSISFVPDPTLKNASNYATVVVIPEGGTENNTLASYDSCFNDNYDVPGYIGDAALFTYIPKYLGPATARMQMYAPTGFTFNTNDTYAMQSICAYENAYLGYTNSEFCNLFTAAEWEGFEYTLDIEYYYDYSFGNPTGRAQGLGYLQELLARLEHQYIPVSNSSVNSTLDNNAQSFPLNQPFYADFTHDDIIVSTMTAMSLDYFHQAPSPATYPPDVNRHFRLSNMTPFGGRLITEVIGCAAPNPAPVKDARVQYYPTQYGWNPANATNKFIRMRLNHGILPLNTLRGGACDNGRGDGMCSMSSFLTSQKNATALANYDFACFGNYNATVAPVGGKDYDGTIYKS